MNKQWHALLQLTKLAEQFSAVWQDGKPELAKKVLSDDVVSLDLLFGNEIKGYDNWAKMVNGIFEVGLLLGLPLEFPFSCTDCCASLPAVRTVCCLVCCCLTQCFR